MVDISSGVHIMLLPSQKPSSPVGGALPPKKNSGSAPEMP